MRDTKYGAVETFGDAKKCAALFAKMAEKIDGVIAITPQIIVCDIDRIAFAIANSYCIPF